MSANFKGFSKHWELVMMIITQESWRKCGLFVLLIPLLSKMSITSWLKIHYFEHPSLLLGINQTDSIYSTYLSKAPTPVRPSVTVRSMAIAYTKLLQLSLFNSFFLKKWLFTHISGDQWVPQAWQRSLVGNTAGLRSKKHYLVFPEQKGWINNFDK